MKSVNNILIINLMYIGDLLFTTPLLHALRVAFPSAHIAMLADEKNSGVITYNPNLSELITIDKKGYHNKLPNYLRLIADIRKRNFDLVINLHANERSSAIAAFSGAQKIVGFSAKGFSLFFDSLVKERRDIHQADAYLGVLQAVGVDKIDRHGLEMWVDEATEVVASEIWEKAFPNSQVAMPQVIGLNTGGSWPTKRWTKQGFAELADQLLTQNYGVAFFGGPMDVDDVTQILSLMKCGQHEKLAVFTGKTSLLEMAALVKKCTALITGDSGPMHIAVSRQVLVVGIFGPSDAARYAPYQQESNVIKLGCDCQPCGKHHCEIGHLCMGKITVNMILTKLQALKIN